jgi:hypothetical protein
MKKENLFIKNKKMGRLNFFSLNKGSASLWHMQHNGLKATLSNVVEQQQH